MKFILLSFLLTFLYVPALFAGPKPFPIVTKQSKVSILYSREGATLDSIAANLLALDIERVTSYRPPVLADLAEAKGTVIVIGAIGSTLVQAFLPASGKWKKELAGAWERYGMTVRDKPVPGISKALVIAGSDPRGTAYGVFSLSEKIGVSPWYWWADAPVKRKEALTVNHDDYISPSPSVKYRGIFINDEDWGLQPWAADTFEPETGDIGPKTYAKIFELLLRLKANLIWPAMHPSTKPFYTLPGNKKLATDYAIVVGSSHAEPLLRNNVGEWNEKTMGRFNYITNRENVYRYWESRVIETAATDVIYSMGMRGVHDSGMEGIKEAKEAVPLLERIIAKQRELLQQYAGKPASAVPQAFTAYKEVLDIYDNGLRLPEDITLVWPDDNYGYIQRLNNEAERKRMGGSGVYYHASYWGRPHDYLWLSSTHPALIQSEMMKAYSTGADKLWVLNVGDIKPIEYNIHLFLDMAYCAQPFRQSGYAKKHLAHWAATIFGPAMAASITDLLWEYHQLAFERRPEFMGWSQTEPTTKTALTAYNHFAFGDEAQRRLNRYATVERRVKALRRQCGEKAAAAFYQLVYYPIIGAAWMNRKFLYRDKAFLYAGQHRFGARNMAARAKEAYDSIVKETVFYNKQLSGGKWNGIMSMKPRDLPVYQAPVLPIMPQLKGKGIDAVPENYDTLAVKNGAKKSLPQFKAGLTEAYFIDVFLRDSAVANWTAQASHKWIKLSAKQGRLLPDKNYHSTRLWVSVDKKKLTNESLQKGTVKISADGDEIRIDVSVYRPAENDFHTFKGFVEKGSIVSMYAANFTTKTSGNGKQWKKAGGLGHTGASLVADVPDKKQLRVADPSTIKNTAPYVSYTFYSFSDKAPVLAIYTLPTHPLNKNNGMRYAVSVDEGPVHVVDFKTVGRSEEWKQNVLRNAAIKEVALQTLLPGRHTLKIYAIDPGVVLDRLLLKFGPVAPHYGLLDETIKK